jgi:oligoribonuclease NrnB/cAMP/cGMP phosphodiesterase (DHH superfamily)
VPKLVDYVEDRDLWKFKYPETRALSDYVFSNPYTFENWDKLLNEFEDDLTRNSAVAKGEAINAKHNKDIDELSKLKFRTDIGGYNVWAANVPYTYASDLAGKLAEGEPFGVTYFYDGPRDKYVYSLRSKEDGVDVSEIAKTFGGGGHQHAAGFESPLGALKVCTIGG